MDFEKVIEKRASVRRYSSKKVKLEQVMEIIQDAGNLAPSPGNLPIVRYVVIDDPKLIEKIGDACQQQFIKQAPFLIVICTDSKSVEKAYDKRTNTYVKHHVGAVIENMLLKITNMKLVSCWVGAFSDTTIRTALDVSEGIDIEAVIPIGYPLVYDKTKQKRKPAVENRIYFNTYKNKHYKPYGKIGEG